jgi:metal-responsive CopG/Arc/MetJ family transcriptional regulator
MKMAAAHVPDDMLADLDEIARRRGVERTKVIRWALTEYINRFFGRTFESTTAFHEVQPAETADVGA